MVISKDMSEVKGWSVTGGHWYGSHLCAFPLCFAFKDDPALVALQISGASVEFDVRDHLLLITTGRWHHFRFRAV